MSSVREELLEVVVGDVQPAQVRYDQQNCYDSDHMRCVHRNHVGRSFVNICLRARLHVIMLVVARAVACLGLFQNMMKV
jgi:hypothetical protein